MIDGGLALLSFKEEVEDEVLPEEPALLCCGLMRLRTLEVKFLENPDNLEEGDEGSAPVVLFKTV